MHRLWGSSATPFLRIEHAPVSCNDLCSSRGLCVWAGSKATTFLNVLRPVAVDYVVDVNPHSMLDGIICLNPNYLDEIAC